LGVALSTCCWPRSRAGSRPANRSSPTGWSSLAPRALSRRGFLGLLGAAAAVAIGGGALWLGRGSQRQLPSAEAVAADVKAEFLRAWRAYARLAWGHDELKPVTGGYQEFFARDHPVGLTIVESLDTLYVMGLDDELAQALSTIPSR
jgi:mannosyl-oligosaccharide alpha-1,2-mannosidase